MAEQVLEDLEFPHRELKRLAGSHHLASDEIHLQIVLLQSEDLIRASTSQQSAYAREQLRKRKGLDEVVVGAAIESFHPIVDGVLRGEDQDGGVEPTLAERGQDFNTITSGQHEIENHEVEELVVHEEESFLSRGRDLNVVVLRLEPFTKGLRDLLFVLDDQDTHGTQEYSDVPYVAAPDMNVRNSS